MSNVLYPSLPGRTWNIKKRPQFATKVQRSVNLVETRASFASTPLWNFTLAYDVLREAKAEFSNLGGFFCARYGSFDSFLLADPYDSVAANVSFGTGDGATTDFQLTRPFGAFTEQVCNVANAPTITVAGNAASHTVSAIGLVSFANAPAANAALLWSGTYYFRCRFTQDIADFNNFMLNLWEAGTVEFIGSLGTKI